MYSSPQSTALFENASMGLIVVNSIGNITLINPFALQLFGYAPEEVVNKPIECLIPHRYHHDHVKDRDNYIHHPRSRPMGLGLDLFAVRKDGSEFPVEVSLGSYQDNGSENVIAFLSDITIRKKAEKELQKLNVELEDIVEKRTEKLMATLQQLEKSKEDLSVALEKEKELGELKSRFVSMASHEFRTPLSTILSSSYLIEKYTTTEDQQKRDKHLRRIISSVTMLTDILNDFLSLGKIEEGKIQVRATHFDMEAFVKDTLDELKSTFKGRQVIQYNHSGPCEVFLDASLLKHIILNLVSNGSKFSREDGVIEIATFCSENEAKLSVKDYGIGISVEDQQHLMERFFRGANAANIQGTGLGLHLISKYAELMNGRVEFTSELEKGTEFIITFNKAL